MLLAVLAAPAAASAGGGSDGPSTEIYYGHEAAAEAFPYQAYVETSVGSCGGVLVGSRQVLTAGHCVSAVDQTAPGNVVVKLGSRDLSTATTYAVERVERNADFSNRTLENDATMITLESAVPYAPLPLVGADQAALWAPGVTATVSGWGERENSTFPDRMYEASIPIRPDSDCDAAYHKDYRPATMLCAGGGTPSTPGADTCSGDSGGPLTVPAAGGPVLAGLTSWGGACSESPGVYTRLGAPTLNGWVSARIPHASFTYAPESPRAGEPVSFSGTGSPPQGAQAFDTFRWDLDGDGQFDDGTGANTAFTFSSAGSHTVGLEASGPSGDRAIARRALEVAPAASAPSPPAPEPRSGGTGGGTADDTLAPRLDIAFPGTRRLGRALRRGVLVSVRCSEPCRVELTLALPARAVRRERVRALLGRRTKPLDTSTRRTFRLRFGPRQAAQLSGLSRLRLHVSATATDAAGNASVVRRSLLLGS